MKTIIAGSVAIIALSWIDSTLFGGRYAPAAVQMIQSIVYAIF